MAFLSVYSKSTGEKHRVPEHYMEDGSPFADDFSKTPRQKAADNAEANAKAAPKTPASGDTTSKEN